MAKKKTKGPSKSQAVRDYLTEHPGATASVVIPALAQRGIDVSPALVNQVKTRMKRSGELDGQSPAPVLTKKSTATKRASKKATAKKAAPATSPTSKSLTADDLVEAKKLADELGGIDQARKALKYLEELG